MKKSFFWLPVVAILFAILSLVSCSTLTAAQQVALRKAVKDSLSSKHYKIDVDMMYPQRGGAENVASNWSLEVKGDTLVSYLPYVGLADFVPIGGGRGMNFTAPISKYHAVKDGKGATRITMLVNNDEERMEISIDVQLEGQSHIEVMFQNRDRIGYGGMLDADYE